MSTKLPSRRKRDANAGGSPDRAGERLCSGEQIEQTYAKLRRRYPEVHGREVDWISHGYDEGYLFFNVRFTDGKNFSILCSPEIVTNIVDFSDMRTGDDVVIREYYRRLRD